MDQPYSVVADVLSKFHTAPEWIQALWLVAVPVTVLGAAWILMRPLTLLVAPLTRNHWRGRLIYGVYQDDQGRWLLYRYGSEPHEIEWADPPEPAARGQVSQGGLRRRED